MLNPQSSPNLQRRWRPAEWAGPVLLVLITGTYLGWDLASEPHFMDESAYISQSFYADLWLNGRWDDPSWLAYGGYDLPPLAKYLVGFALRAEGYRRPGPMAMFAWYDDPGSRFVSDQALTAARRPSVLFGIIGCLATYAIGTLTLDRRLGWTAALLLMLNPLYAMHARRAMSDLPAEALILSTVAVGLWAWKRILPGKLGIWPILAMVFACGILGGLATLAKLNGSLGGLTLGAWACLACVLRSFLVRSRVTIVLATMMAGVVSFGTFASLNPFLFAHPQGRVDPRVEPVARLGFFERVKVVADHRVNVSTAAKTSFPHNALNNLVEKIEAVAIQGFGRFGPLGPRGWTDSTIRFDWKQDWGGVIWLPWVGLGFLFALLRGRIQIRKGEPLTAWAVAVQAGVATVVVTSFIPLAWDRYFLSIQPGCALLGGFAAVGVIDWTRTFFLTEPTS